LEKMEQGRSLDEAVEIVASKGVAETNPRLDIEGWDAAAKCVIVARSLFDGKITIDDVDRTGIDSLETADVVDAAMSGKPIRLLATIQPGPNGPIAVVTPTPLEPTNPLAHLRGGSLGVIYDAPPLGSLFLASDAVGTGGGGPPTAAAVIRDIVGLRANRSGN
jgi:homoserine dehydrogenase